MKEMTENNYSCEKFITSSRRNPCPVCQRDKDGDCRILDWGDRVLCHTYQDGATPVPGYRYIKNTDKGAGWGIWYRGEAKRRVNRKPEQEQIFNYPDRNGNPLIRVHRRKGSNPEFWQSYWVDGRWKTASKVDSELKAGLRAKVPIYRYQEIQNAIANGEMIFWVEGETSADALWGIGLAATTSIGGCKGYESWGTYQNDLSGATVVICPDRDRVGLVYAERIAQDFPEAQWLYAFPDSPVWNHPPSSDGVDVVDWISDYKLSSVQIMAALTNKKTSVTGDTHVSGDTPNSSPLTFSATVTSVTATLRQGWREAEEINELEGILARSAVGKEAFWKLVSSIRAELDTIQRDDIGRFEALVRDSKADVDWDKALPHMAKSLKKSAKVLNIHPMGIWQPFLPAVLSLVGQRIKLDVESHEIPANAYTCLVGDSGDGKTRGKKLVLAPLEKWQVAEHREHKERKTSYEEEMRSCGKDSEPPEKPQPEVKRLFKIATIQSVVKRLSEQEGHGSLWARDEIAGLFKSLNQFSKGDNEALEILLELWDDGYVQCDRVSDEDSFLAENLCLSVTGGIQPMAFQEAFKNPKDPQGLQARFLFAHMKPQPWKAGRGYAPLADELPALYSFLRELPETTLLLSPKAYERYSQIGEWAWLEAEKQLNPAIKAWLKKLVGQLLRIALALHCIEAYYEPQKREQMNRFDANPLIDSATIERAWEFCRYYCSCFKVIQEKVSVDDTEDNGAILFRIWDKALTHLNGATPRDMYREVKCLQRQAKDAGLSASGYTLLLFSELEKEGYGEVRRDKDNPRIVKFWASQDRVPLPPTQDGGDTGDTGDTMPETLIEKELEGVTISQEKEECHRGHSQKQLEAYTEEDIKEIAQALMSDELIPDKETLALCRQCWNPQAMNAACKRLSYERHSLIKQWVIQLNQASTNLDQPAKVERV